MFWAHELPVTPARVRMELAAYDYLSCWCRLEQPCHVDEYQGNFLRAQAP